MSSLEDKNFGENVLHKIKEEKILPKPRWQFLLKNSIIWGLGVFSLILGAISTSLIVYMINGDDAGAYDRAGSGLLESLLFIIPFFWLICLGFFAFSVFYYIKHTKNGYKYSAKKIILIIVGGSLVLGGLLNLLGIDKAIDDVLGERAPLYDRVINPRFNYWSSPDSGRLTGLVVAHPASMEYDLVDRSGDVWVALSQRLDSDDKMPVGRPVRLIGKRVGSHSFVIKEVISVGPGREFFKRHLPPRGFAVPANPESCTTNDNSGSCALPFPGPHVDFIGD